MVCRVLDLVGYKEIWEMTINEKGPELDFKESSAAD
jgi:hypothetical protein